MSGIFQFSVRMQTELEAKMTSVERIDYYIKVSSEKNYLRVNLIIFTICYLQNIEDERKKPEVTVNKDWPEKGEINFNSVRFVNNNNHGNSTNTFIKYKPFQFKISRKSTVCFEKCHI